MTNIDLDALATQTADAVHTLAVKDEFYENNNALTIIRAALAQAVAQAEQAQFQKDAAVLESLRRSHLINDDDCYYSCPLAVYADGSSAHCGAASGVCDCGAAEYNARIDATLHPAAPEPGQEQGR